MESDGERELHSRQEKRRHIHCDYSRSIVNDLKLATAQGWATKFTVSMQLRTGTVA